MSRSSDPPSLQEMVAAGTTVLQPPPNVARRLGDALPRPPVLDGPTIDGAMFVCFTNRSGSNLVCSLLESTGRYTGRPNEVFRPEFVASKAPGLEVDDLAGYCRAMAARQQAEYAGEFLTKIGWATLFHLAAAGVLEHVFRAPSFILCRRDDVLAQAASYVIARRSGSWRTDAPQRDQTPDTPTHPAHLLKRMRGITRADRNVKVLLRAGGYSWDEVEYDRLRSDPRAALRAPLARIGYDTSALDSPEQGPSRQTSDTNRELIEAARTAYRADPADHLEPTVPLAPTKKPRSITRTVIVVAGTPSSADAARAGAVERHGAVDAGAPWDPTADDPAGRLLKALDRARGRGPVVVSLPIDAVAALVADGDIPGSLPFPTLIDAAATGPAPTHPDRAHEFYEASRQVQLLRAMFPFADERR